MENVNNVIQKDFQNVTMIKKIKYQMNGRDMKKRDKILQQKIKIYIPKT